VFDTQPTFIQNTPWTYLSAYTNCEECSFGPPTPTPTTTPTTTPTPTPSGIASECYILESAPFGGCSIQYVNEFGSTVTNNIPAEDEGLCFTICARSIISDTCGFSSVGVGCSDPLCDCNPPETTPTATPTPTSTIGLTPTPTSSPTVGVEIFTHGTVLGSCSDYCFTNYNINVSTSATANYASLTIGDTIFGQGGLSGYVAYSDVSTDTTTGPFKIAEIDSSGEVVGIFICVGGSCEPL
jgi:hypothetical protein